MKTTYERQIEAWNALRVSSLKNETGWLALVAGEWLRDGPNVVHNLGTITLNRGKVNVQLVPDVSGTIGERPFTWGFIRTEADKGGPDRVKVDSRTFIIIKRGERFVFRMWDANSEARKKFLDVNRYAVSTKWRIEAQWEPYGKPKAVSFQTSLKGYNEKYAVPGIAGFNIGGRRMQLEPVAEEGSEQLVFVFSDETNGAETNADGRYLYAFPANNAIVVLDFNKAINPPCAFTPYATCPLPHQSNRLNVRIDAGEKKYEMYR